MFTESELQNRISSYHWSESRNWKSCRARTCKRWRNGCARDPFKAWRAVHPKGNGPAMRKTKEKCTSVFPFFVGIIRFKGYPDSNVRAIQ